MNNALLALLFFLISPGVLLTLPAGSKGLWMSRQTSVASALVHALVFVVGVSLLNDDEEGFNNKEIYSNIKRTTFYMFIVFVIGSILVNIALSWPELSKGAK